MYGLRYKFFLGEVLAAGTLDDDRVRREIEQYDDIVSLGVSEGYRMNSRKGVLFLEWIALHSSAEFLLKTDDDVYFRPSPLVEQLRERVPAGYVWGFFDNISPVPRDPEDHFYNTNEDFPFEVFPPYPRGVIRVLSMDVVRLIAEANRKGQLRMIYGDDPCIGVHLRQLVFSEESPIPSLTIDDRDSYGRFAMEPSCHPQLWSRVTSKTWAVHHVKPEQIVCMWGADLAAGYHVESSSAGLWVNSSVPLDDFPDLCGCATDPSFLDRTDTEDLRSETERVLFDEAPV